MTSVFCHSRRSPRRLRSKKYCRSDCTDKISSASYFPCPLLFSADPLPGSVQYPHRIRRKCSSTGIHPADLPPRSHLETVRSLTCNISAACFWVIPFSFRRPKSTSPVFLISMAFASFFSHHTPASFFAQQTERRIEKAIRKDGCIVRFMHGDALWHTRSSVSGLSVWYRSVWWKYQNDPAFPAPSAGLHRFRSDVPQKNDAAYEA